MAVTIKGVGNVDTGISEAEVVQLEGDLSDFGIGSSFILGQVRSIAAIASATGDLGMELSLSVEKEVAEGMRAEILGESVRRLGLNVRIIKVLEGAGIDRIQDLVEKTALELLALKNFGGDSLRELHERLGAKGLALRG